MAPSWLRSADTRSATHRPADGGPALDTEVTFTLDSVVVSIMMEVPEADVGVLTAQVMFWEAPA